MANLKSIVGSSVGKKVLVAVTGLSLFGFVIVHLIGNLTLFIPDGGKAFNEYAHFLEGAVHGGLIIVFEIGLILLAVVHVIFAISSSLIDKNRARPQKYALSRRAGGKSRRTLASVSMIVTGPILLLFVILHVRMFKYADHPAVTYDGQVMKNLHAVVVEAFKVPWITVGYMAVMLVLGTHLWHGVWSAFQSLGWNSDRHIKLLTTLSVLAAIVLGLGFLVLPAYIYLFVDPVAAAAGGH